MARSKESSAASYGHPGREIRVVGIGRKVIERQHRDRLQARRAHRRRGARRIGRLARLPLLILLQDKNAQNDTGERADDLRDDAADEGDPDAANLVSAPDVSFPPDDRYVVATSVVAVKLRHDAAV